MAPYTGGYNVGQLYTNPLLANVLFTYRYENFIGKRVIKPVKVEARMFRIQTFNDGPFRIPNAKTGPRGKVEQIEIRTKQDTYMVDDYYLEEPVDRIEQGVTAPFSLKATATEFIAQNLELIYDQQVAATIFDPANYATGNKTNLPAGQRFTDPASHPIKIIKAGLRASMAWPDKLVFGIEAWDAFQEHDVVLKTFGIQGGAGGRVGVSISEAAVAGYFGVKEVLVGRERYDASFEGDEEDPQFIWGPHVAALHNPDPTGTKDMVHTFAGSETLADAMEFFHKDPGPKGTDFVRAGWNYIIIVKNNRYGYLIENAA